MFWWTKFFYEEIMPKEFYLNFRIWKKSLISIFFLNFPCIFEISRNDNNILPYFIFQKFENHNLQLVILNWWFGKNIYLMTQILRIICKSAIVCYGNLCCILSTKSHGSERRSDILSANLAPFGTDWAWPEESDFTEMLHGRFSTRNVRQIPGTSCCSIYTPLDLQEAIKLETDILVKWLVLVWTLKFFVQNCCNCNCF